jgi:hypothetical protein
MEVMAEIVFQTAQQGASHSFCLYFHETFYGDRIQSGEFYYS